VAGLATLGGSEPVGNKGSRNGFGLDWKRVSWMRVSCGWIRRGWMVEGRL
jgi:hypothetical protein